MYLKSIEIQGFKSFANKLLFEFHDGITAIVGPNGSGKSNVGDAVRWVLGEQSAKQLRGTKMEDIIFSGTEARKPLGFAYVAITLDNSDHKLPIEYEEVTVARRVFRSGESEYLINGSNCRLKDVQELFLDTGIGKEGYSIIGQGQIEKILSGKPEERRELFDEAAGIVKFKKRKAVAEKNLEAEKQNLYRINDILSELEKQVEPLEKQSTVAKEYLKLRDELKSLDVSMFLMEYTRIEGEQQQVKEKIAVATNDLENTKRSYDAAKEEYEKLEKLVEQYNQEIDAKKAVLSETKVRKEQCDGEIKVIQEKIIASKQSEEHFQNRLGSIQSAMVEKQQELNSLQEDKEQHETRMKELIEEQKEIERQVLSYNQEIEQFKEEIEAFKANIFEILSNNSSIKSNQQRYATMLEQNSLRKVTLNQRLLKNKSEEAVNTNKIKELKEKLLSLQEQQQTVQESMNSLRQAVNESQEELQRMNSDLEKKRQEFHREQSRLEYLTNITERYEGYGNSIRKVMEQKEKIPGIHGVVADIIKVKKEYETAVETALGGSIQNIVTENETTAKQLIEFLKKNKFGRATFLPLTSISNRSTFNNQQVLKESGVHGLASNLVETDPLYRQVVEALLGRIVVVNHIDTAITLSKKYQYSLRIVTMEGDLINPGGAMSGGAYKNSSNLLGRRREMEDLTNKVQELKESIEQMVNQQKERQQTINTFKTQMEENKKEQQNIILSTNTAKMQLNQAIVDLQNVRDAYDEIKQEIQELEVQVSDLNSNIQNLEESLEKNQEENKENELKIKELEQKVLEKSQQLSIVNESVSSVKLKRANLEQSNEFKIENMKRINDEIRKLKVEKEELDSNLNQSVQTMDDNKKLIEEITEQIGQYGLQIVDLEETIKEISVKKEEVTTKHKSFFAKREELSERTNQLDKELYRLNNLIEKLSEQLNHQIDYMWEEYEITYSVAKTMEPKEEQSLSSVKKTIHDLKLKIKKLGDVNINAIEDYKNLMERFELLKTQRDDLIEAEEHLKGIIEELDTEMRKQFEEKFKQIKEQFNLVFNELFGGGKGTLELVEDEDLLEAGIRINAQPPGKKLQNMMQLSGGEKSLTAICLLFAIQNLKPSPFCLLDEIEAALDDSNVKRYAKYLEKLTDHTQFIVITHRRGTMNAADRLYGITMQEKGVSTLVSVNLIEDELEE